MYQGRRINVSVFTIVTQSKEKVLIFYSGVPRTSTRLHLYISHYLKQSINNLYSWPGISRGVFLHVVQSNKAPGGQGTCGYGDRKSQVHTERQPAVARGCGVPDISENAQMQTKILTPVTRTSSLILIKY